MTNRFPVIGAHDFDQFTKAQQAFFAAVLKRMRSIETLLSTAAVSTTLPSVTSATATDLASVITLANELKADFTTAMTALAATISALNEALAALRDNPVQLGG